MTLIFSTERYQSFGEALRGNSGFDAGTIERAAFSDGERYRRIETGVAGRHAVLVGGTISDEATLEIFDLGCTLVREGARSLTLVVPYFGHSTMERAVLRGEVVAAKTRAMLLSSIPPAPSGNRILLLDLHSEGIPYYFEGSVRPFHVYGKEMVFRAARELGGSDFVLASTDAGRAKWVESLANDLGVDAAFVFKRRERDERTTVSGITARVEGKRVLIYDDMVRTGGSLLHAAEAYREAGATSVAAIVTHGVLPGDALQTIESSGLLTALVCSDSHPRAQELASSFLRVESVAPLFAPYLAI